MFCIPDFISATSSCCSCQIWLVLLIVFRNILIWVIGQNTLRNVFIRLCLWHWLTFRVNSEIINNDIQNKSRCIIPEGNQFYVKMLYSRRCEFYLFVYVCFRKIEEFVCANIAMERLHAFMKSKSLWHTNSQILVIASKYEYLLDAIC